MDDDKEEEVGEYNDDDDGSNGDGERNDSGEGDPYDA